MSADNSTATPPVAATYSTVTAVNSQSVAAHGPLEVFLDISDAGTLTSTAAQSVGLGVLAAYQRASFAGPFTVSYGQLLNTGGTPVDIGADQANNVCRLILTDFGYGGEIAPNIPITFLIGQYEYNDFTQTATITPFASPDLSLSGMLSAANNALMPITVAS